MKSLKTGRLSDVRVLFFNQIQNSNYNWGLNESNNILCIQEWLTAYQHSWNCCDLFISSKCSSFDLISINVIVCVCIEKPLTNFSSIKVGHGSFLTNLNICSTLIQTNRQMATIAHKAKGKKCFFYSWSFWSTSRSSSPSHSLDILKSSLYNWTSTRFIVFIHHSARIIWFK